LQPDAERQTYDNTIPTEILLQAGGPVLFVPYIFRGAFKAKRIGICWDGSRLAARALKDATPFLAQADIVCAISVNGPENTPADASLEKLAKHLARCGLPIKLVDLPAPRSDVQPSILSLAADENFDMLVMGAYGHSRLQEGGPGWRYARDVAYDDDPDPDVPLNGGQHARPPDHDKASCYCRTRCNDS
jgi:hypothetical protein